MIVRREPMLKRPESGGQMEMVGERIVPLDRSRTSITLLVVFYHSVINYTHYGIGGDNMRWIGFDGVVLFCDSFFMACMFFISGLFVRDGLARRGAGNYLASRAWRLGVPYLVSVLVIMPLAYYRYWLQFDFAHYYWQMITVGPWSAGSAWFLFALLAFDAMATLMWVIAPRAIGALGHCVNGVRDRPMLAFAIFILFSIAVYLPLRLIFGDASWLTAGHYPVVIQTSRILLYAGYLLAGIAVGAAGLRQGPLAEGGAFARRWSTWISFALAFYAAIVVLVYVHHSGLIDFKSPPLWWHTAYGLAFALFCASMTFFVPAVFLRFAKSSARWLDAMQKNAYGIYLLHFIPLIWMQYLVYDLSLPAFAKFAIVFAVTLSTSWAATSLLRRIPVLARMI